MIHSKNSTAGFTLIEVLFSIAIIGLVLTPLFITQSNFLQWVARQSDQLHRAYAGEQFMLNSYIQFEQDNSKRTATKKIDNPPTTFNYRIVDASPAVKKLLRNIYTQEVAIEWEQDRTKFKDKLVTFLFLPEMKKQ